MHIARSRFWSATLRTYLLCYISQLFLVYYTPHHRSELFHKYSNCRALSFLHYLSQQQGSSDIWSVWIAQYSKIEVWMSYLIYYSYNIMHLLTHKSRSIDGG